MRRRRRASSSTGAGAALIPPLRRAWDAFPIRPEVAAAAGLSPATRVHCGAHDSNLSLVPAHPVARGRVQRRLDRHLGHPDGGRRPGAARSRLGHARQCRCHGAPDALRALHGRARIRRARRRAAGPHRPRTIWPPSSPPAPWLLPAFSRPGRPVRRPRRADRGRAAAVAGRPHGAGDALCRADEPVCCSTSSKRPAIGSSRAVSPRRRLSPRPSPRWRRSAACCWPRPPPAPPRARRGSPIGAARGRRPRRGRSRPGRIPGLADYAAHWRELARALTGAVRTACFF